MHLTEAADVLLAGRDAHAFICGCRYGSRPSCSKLRVLYAQQFKQPFDSGLDIIEINLAFLQVPSFALLQAGHQAGKAPGLPRLRCAPCGMKYAAQLEELDLAVLLLLRFSCRFRSRLGTMDVRMTDCDAARGFTIDNRRAAAVIPGESPCRQYARGRKSCS